MGASNDMKVVAERFWAKVAIGEREQCWPWLGARSERGYGRFSLRGRNMRATRVAILLTRGEAPPSGLHVCHTCDNPICVNPSHLWIGTHHQNMADLIAKGRHQNKSKTHCPSGHPYSSENTYVVKLKGYRQCRICRRKNGRVPT